MVSISQVPDFKNRVPKTTPILKKVNIHALCNDRKNMIHAAAEFMAGNPDRAHLTTR